MLIASFNKVSIHLRKNNQMFIGRNYDYLLMIVGTLRLCDAMAE